MNTTPPLFKNAMLDRFARAAWFALGGVTGLLLLVMIARTFIGVPHWDSWSSLLLNESSGASSIP